MLVEERLSREKHFISAGNFCCGADNPLNDFLSDEAFDYDEKQYGKTYVLMLPGVETDILGFYTLKASGIQVEEQESGEFNSIPVIEIARIAIQHDIQKSGIGKYTFYTYILPKIIKVAELVAVKAIIAFVEPEDKGAIAFYSSIGFEKATESVQKEILDSFNEECDLYIVSLDNIKKGKKE